MSGFALAGTALAVFARASAYVGTVYIFQLRLKELNDTFTRRNDIMEKDVGIQKMGTQTLSEMKASLNLNK
jgi:hypothetical protein